MNKKHDATMCGLQETHFRFKDINSLKVKEQKKYILHTITKKKPEQLY